MTSTEDYPHQLIQRPLPTLRVRHFQRYEWALSLKTVDVVQTCDVFSLTRVASICSSFSRAAFRNLEAVIVPAPHSLGFLFSIDASWAPASKVCSKGNEVANLDGCEHFSLGGVNDMPAPIVVRCDFDALHIVPLVKPAPSEGFRTRFFLSFDAIPHFALPESELKKREGKELLRVYFRGDIEVAGAA